MAIGHLDFTNITLPTLMEQYPSNMLVSAMMGTGHLQRPRLLPARTRQRASEGWTKPAVTLLTAVAAFIITYNGFMQANYNGIGYHLWNGPTNTDVHIAPGWGRNTAVLVFAMSPRRVLCGFDAALQVSGDSHNTNTPWTH